MKEDTDSAVRTENRWLAIIMYTDIVGFSRQLGTNEAYTLQLLAYCLVVSRWPLSTAS
jgi:hypothetical protein